MKVVILGTLKPERPIPDDYSVWQINRWRPDHYARRPDVLFQLHGLGHLRMRHGEGFLGELAALAAAGTIVYMTQQHPEVPGMARFPVEEMRDKFGDYFTGSFAYAIALAVYRGAEEIRLDGINFLPDEQGREEMWAVPCIEFHLGIAAGRGISLDIPPGKGLMGPGRWSHRYGYEGGGSE